MSTPYTVVAPTIAVSTSPAYSIGDSIGGKITLTDALQEIGGPAELVSIMMIDRANQKPVGVWLFFDADPTAATITDNAAFVFSTDDAKVVANAVIGAADWASINSKGVANVKNVGTVVKATAGKDLYAAYVLTTGTPTFVATSDLIVHFNFKRLK